jgi:hypothetical protein
MTSRKQTSNIETFVDSVQTFSDLSDHAHSVTSGKGISTIKRKYIAEFEVYRAKKELKVKERLMKLEYIIKNSSELV